MINIGMRGYQHREPCWINSNLLHIWNNCLFGGGGYSAVDKDHAVADKQILEQVSFSVERTNLMYVFVEFHCGKLIAKRPQAYHGKFKCVNRRCPRMVDQFPKPPAESTSSTTPSTTVL